MSAMARQYALDLSIREGIEYLPTFWELVGLHQKLARTEREFERAVLQRQRAEVLRRAGFDQTKHVDLYKLLPATRRRLDKLDAQIRALRH